MIAGRMVLAGVTSAGDPDAPCKPNSQAYDAEIIKYLPWLKQQIAKSNTGDGTSHQSDLDPLVNASNRYIEQRSYERLPRSAPIWQNEVSLEETFSVVRVSIVASLKAKDVLFSVKQVGEAAPFYCLPSALSNVHICEFKRPPIGKLLLRVEGSPGQEFQIVAVGFRG